MQQYLPQFAVLIVLGTLIFIGVWLLLKAQNTKPTDDDLAALCRYFEEVNTARAFPTVDVTVTTKKGEFALINEWATLYEMRAHRESVGVSFRVARGVYVGKRAYASKDHLDRTAVGTVILTSQRLLFVGSAKTMTIQIANIITAHAGGNSLQIHSEKRQRPVVLEFPSAQLAALLIAAFLRHPFAENALPKDMTITATPMPSHDGITLTFKDADEPQCASLQDDRQQAR
jgi:hypothetical protein